MENFDKVKQFIVKHKVNQKLISQYIGIKPNTFSAKMKGHGYHKFTQKQQVEIVAFLKELGTELEDLTKKI